MPCSKAVAPIMQQQGQGRIVDIASVAGSSPKILVNCIAPGYLEGTRATDSLAAEFRVHAREGSFLKKAADMAATRGLVQFDVGAQLLF
jgi:3-oxoacyl-[acyl-carrier protein] reductase